MQHLMFIFEIRRNLVGLALALMITFILAVVATSSAHAQTFSVLYSFTGASGSNPNGSLARDSEGNLYGTTPYGGLGNCSYNGTVGCGTVFKVDKKGKETVLYSFTGARGDGAFPAGGLLRDTSGNLYGTTWVGGAIGVGTVFKIDKTGNETILHSFGAGSDGAYPTAGVVRDAQGNLYGTTEWGGSGCSACGAVFKMDTTGNESVLYSFTGTGGDGSLSNAGVVRDAQGNLYGTTANGGSYGQGTVFKVDTVGKETVLYSFQGIDGSLPDYGSLIRDTQGNLYGVTIQGGANGYGTVFKVNKKGKETVLYNFTGAGGDGANPTGSLVRNAQGDLYGTTEAGGSYGYGTVFKIDASLNETVLYTFTGTEDGASPPGGLVLDAKGSLYGAADLGGLGNCSDKFGVGCGVVFKVAP
jgi:uncharacterized repeat protein (TIGR03803 family)